MSRWFLVSLVYFVAYLSCGCVSTIITTAPPCPAWSEQAIAELETMAVIDPDSYPALFEAIARQEQFCQAIDPPEFEDVCVGSRLACWWGSVFQ